MPRPKAFRNGEARPFLKWAGGKRQLLDELVARVPREIGTYHEPFLGGGALFFRLRTLRRFQRAHLSDVNPELINAWRSVQLGLGNLLEELERLAERTLEDDYYAIRALDPAALTRAQRAARLIYLNKTGFNGLYRENRKGIFNVPYGHNSAPRVLDRENLLAVSQALAGTGVELEQAPFSAVLERAQPGDFVYFDPPYVPLSASSSFTDYSRDGFGVNGQRELARVARELAGRGVEVLLSNSSAPLVYELYRGKGFQIEEITALRAINCKGEGRGAVKELLIRAHSGSPKARSARASGRQLRIDFGRGAG